MTYYVTALSNDRARLIRSETRTTCPFVASFAADHAVSLGYVVVRREEA